VPFPVCRHVVPPARCGGRRGLNRRLPRLSCEALLTLGAIHVVSHPAKRGGENIALRRSREPPVYPGRLRWLAKVRTNTTVFPWKNAVGLAMCKSGSPPDDRAGQRWLFLPGTLLCYPHKTAKCHSSECFKVRAAAFRDRRLHSANTLLLFAFLSNAGRSLAW
jgi:hypothetical protein